LDKPITICFVYFRSLTPANLAAALFSVRKQDFSAVREMVIIDNDTEDPLDAINRVVDSLDFPVPVHVYSYKHGDGDKTHSWSTNTAVMLARTPWVFFTRADFLLDFDAVKKFWMTAVAQGFNWRGFVTSNGYHLHVDISRCEKEPWRSEGAARLRCFNGTEIAYTIIDTGVWLARKKDFDAVIGLDEGLTAWGHAQTHFQWKLHKDGVEFVRIPEALYFHPIHSAERNIDSAHRQLGDLGVDLREMWSRYEGPKVY
jgi:hypothetical protein